MAAEDVAKIVVLMCSLPPEVNLYEATILPNHMRSSSGAAEGSPAPPSMLARAHALK